MKTSTFFAVKDPEEVRVITFDFAAALNAGETITGTPVITKEVAALIGGATNTTDISLGAPTVSGGTVLFNASLGTDNVNYELRCKITTTPDVRTLLDAAILPVRKK
jgi:hypothetical protein